MKSDFYRCKSCHAWDGLGNAGSYAARTGQSTGKATRPDVSSVNLRASAAKESPSELFDLIARPSGRGIDAADNTHPNYSAVLSDEQIWNIVKFMREEWVNPSDLYDLSVTGPKMQMDYSKDPPELIKPTLTYANVGKDGDATRGAEIFAAKCAVCHGANGKQLPDVDGFTGVGQFLRAKPNEAWFKMKFGVPTHGMPPGLLTQVQDLKDVYKVLTDTSLFPD